MTDAAEYERFARSEGLTDREIARATELIGQTQVTESRLRRMAHAAFSLRADGLNATQCIRAATVAANNLGL